MGGAVKKIKNCALPQVRKEDLSNDEQGRL